MPQETNLNVSPYFDDFDSEKDYYKVLFKPGYPIQARELTTVQSILQNQIEQHGKNIFKDGSVVIPGQLKYENPFYAVEIEENYNGIPISEYFDQLLGKRIVGASSEVTAEIVYLLSNTDSERGNFTLYVKYLGSGGANFENKKFQDSETLLLQNPLSYNGLIFREGQGFCNTIASNAISEGSAVSIADGIYFIRGFFVNVKSQTILLDQYGSVPSYKIGLNVNEKIVTSDEDGSLFDNAQGFSNYAAPGADRFKIELELSKRELNDADTQNFVEILRVTDGTPEFFQKNIQYNLIREELARRTSETSGDYVVKPFSLTVRDSLNDRVLNRGIFFKEQLTAEGNTPSDDLMVYQLNPGKAYVSGYEVETISSKLLDVPKARTTSTVDNRVLTLNAGSLFIANNGYGSPKVGLGTTSTVKLMDSRIGTNRHQPSGTEIGVARIYDFVPESDYVNQTSRLQVRLIDIETYTSIELTQNITLSAPAAIKGRRSGAVGYLRQNVSNSKTLNLYGVSGNFLKNEPISINEIDNNRLIVSVKDYDLSDVKSLHSQVGITTFNCDIVLSRRTYIAPPGTNFNINNGVVSAGADKNFSNLIKVGDIVSYANTNYTGDSIYNRVISIGTGGTNFTLSGITTVSGVCDGTLPSGSFNITNILKLTGNFSTTDSSLLTFLDKKNVNYVNILEGEILQRRFFESVNVTSTSSLTLIIDPSDVDAYFAEFDEDRFVITYPDGTVEPMRSDKYSRNPSNAKELTFNGLSKNSGTANVIATVVNRSPSEKRKILNKVSNLVISNSKLSSSGIGTTTLSDGLTYSNVYGTRVQDREICLNVPDVVRVLAVYESTGTNDPELPYLQLTSFTGTNNNNQDYNLGEKISGKISGSVAIIVSRKDSDKLEYVYLNDIPFQVGEIIEGEDSKTNSIITFRSIGDVNITQNFLLDDGQRDHFYDYSRLIRKREIVEPLRKLRVIFQNYTINSNDTGEFITANSYPSDGFKYDIPVYENNRLTDAIDIRPRVAPYALSSISPFEFNGRNFASDGQYSKYIIAPEEDLLVSYSYYQGRMDLIILNPDGKFEVINGIPSDNPTPPDKKINTLDIAEVSVPPYVYNVKNVEHEAIKHKRYRMSDISLLEDRIDRVERYTTLSMLENKTENYQIKDAETGLDRFKCGFFVDNFSTHNYHDVGNPQFKAAIDEINNILRPSHYSTPLELQLGSEAINGVTNTYSSSASHSFVSDLGSSGVKKTGDLVTLNYNEVEYLKQLQASTTENVTPFLIRFWQGSIQLRPSIDIWVDQRTVTNTRFNTIDQSTGAVLNSSTLTTTTINGVTFTDSPSPQTGIIADSFDWIGNARSWIRNIRVVNIPGANSIVNNLINTNVNANFNSAIFGGGALSVSISNQNNLTLTVNRMVANASVFREIRSLVPPDIAEQFISQIQQNNTNRTVRLDFTPANTQGTQLLSSGSTTDSVEKDSTTIRYLRSRNIEFDVSGLKPFTKFYPFFGGVSVDKYIIPKLLEIEMVSGSFVPGETVQSTSTTTSSILRFRLCNPNHKFGPPTAPTQVFQFIPYSKQSIPVSYNQSSTFLNVDTTSLQLPSEVEFYGNATIGMTLRGRTSNAVARITNIRLITDNQGKLIGSLFIPDPSISSNPKWSNGSNTFTVTDVTTLNSNSASTVGVNANESSAEAQFDSSGTENSTVTNVTTTRNVRIIPSSTQSFNIFEAKDPLAQSFYVKESSGVFLTSVEVFFESKDSTESVTLQIRPIISGVPSNIVVPFSEVNLTPSEVSTSPDGSVATKFTFSSPIYLNGPQQQEVRTGSTGSGQSSEYAIVLLSDSSNYRVFISRIGENDLLNTNVKISQQPTLGSLFKSQNGTVWTPAQLEDLKYRINRADFTGNGIVRFYNPKLAIGNDKVTVTGENQFVPLSKRVIIGLGSVGYDYSTVVPGVTIENQGATGTLIGIAGSITVGVGVTISNVGSGYTAGTFNSVNLITETGYGFGAVANVVTSISSGIGTISTVTITNGGNGYQVGDSLIIPEIGKGVGYGGKLTVISIGSSNTFILDNVQGNFTAGISTLTYKNSSGIVTYVGSGVTILSANTDQYYTGQHMKVYQVNHGMHSVENYVKISKFRPIITSTNSRITSNLSYLDSASSIPITSGTGVGFTQFEGKPVNASNIGYIIIGNEVIGYTGVVGDSLTTDPSLRGIDATDKESYDAGTTLYKYEFEGVSLRRINKVHNLSLVDETKHPKDLNYYHIKIDMGATDYDGVGIGSDRTNDLSFNRTIQSGNSGTNITNNIQYEVLTPSIQHFMPPRTNIIPRVRTFTGTSIGGEEESFIDAGYENISLTYPYFFDSPRLICSDVNESRFITDSPGNRSFTLEMSLSTNDSKVSPVIDTSLVSMLLTSNLINNPIGINNDSGYANDNLVRSLVDDNHATIYLSKPVRLKLPANSIKVLLAASISDVNDIRVLYRTYRSDSPNSSSSFDLFPGWSNYQTDSQGIKRVIDSSQNNGSPDTKVIRDSTASFKDYEFSVDNLADFDAFVIKIVMTSSNQARPPLIKDLRAIATVKPRGGE